MPRKTIAKLEEELKTSRELKESYHSDWNKARDLAEKHREDAIRARAEHQDLKRRILALTEANARMLGYVQRVQEDDVVREELVRTGNVDEGPMQLVPKRKHKLFGLEGLEEAFPRHYVDEGCITHDHRAFEKMREELRKKGWVNY